MNLLAEQLTNAAVPIIILVALILIMYRMATANNYTIALSRELAPKYMRLDEYWQWLHAPNSYLKSTPYSMILRGKHNDLTAILNKLIAEGSTPILYDTIFANLFID